MDSIRFGIVGGGAIGPTHAGALKQIDDAQLVAVADLKPERVQAMAEKFGVSRVYSSGDELVADPDVDVVIFATPSGMHADQAVAAMRAGKHVIVEKPMDVTLEACDRMIAAEKQTGRKLAIISQHRWDHASIFVKDAVASGRLGRLMLVDASVKWWRTQKYYDEGDWRGTWALDGGGALMNQGVHTVDLMQWIAGPVKSIHARSSTAGHERIEVEDLIVATLEFASGALGTLTASTACYDGQPARLEVYGTEGSAVIEGDRQKFFKLKDGTTATAEAVSQHALSVARGGTASVKDDAATRLGAASQRDPGAVWGDAHREQIRDFMRAIRDDTLPLIHGVEGRKPIEIIRAMYESAKSGRVVELK
ncbi:MAG TPA: Gfo/Idh/MocA family oxidoreductase [Tepidisphaeraceae bacterium]